ncbi:hypothetical protein C5167_010080 [Papaver somniferum]|uniref:ACB domain-containing protein n=1 Tax=Papaver somniferum TaxID=3469 RepID=A0A4Y7K399_PAPSO|nr:acyl-CoA-binding domain-containing protein 3-like [Papaver somniferum]RZC66389.1 hypothetical protein C5167_010080 [Papaver somniferum]
MDIFKEFILTVLISMCLAFLIAKLVSGASSSSTSSKQESIAAAAAAAAPVKSEKKRSKKKKDKEIVDKEKLVIGERSFVSSELKNTGLQIENKVEESVEVNDVLVDKIDLITKELSDEEVRGENLNKFVEIVGEEEKEVIQVKEDEEDKEVVENLVAETSGRDEIGVELENTSDVVVEKESGLKEEEKTRIDCLVSDDEEWEGIERSEVENYFATASTFVTSGVNNQVLSKLSSDVQMQLYGLRKVATEGPCYEPQPMALMVSARAKWHAWQRLGNMSPEVAMEQYTALLTESVPGWTGRNVEGQSKHDQSSDSPGTEVSGVKHHKITSSQDYQPVLEDERKPGDSSSAERSDGTGGAKIL